MMTPAEGYGVWDIPESLLVHPSGTSLGGVSRGVPEVGVIIMTLQQNLRQRDVPKSWKGMLEASGHP